jgi:hypothetical protein
VGWLIAIGAMFTISARADHPPRPSAADLDFFERKVRPLLVSRCYECHSSQAKTIQGGLRLDLAVAVAKGGDSGPVILPGQPEKSLLVAAVRYTSDLVQMPPTGKLPESEIEILVEWVHRGAPMPADSSAPKAASTSSPIDFAQGRTFWSFQPLRKSAPPACRDATWASTSIDPFILARLEEHGLNPSPPTDRRTLIRRAALDLLGLPPSPEEIEAFVNDPAPDAYARLIERLLASPHYGERYARHWLDLARYSDATDNFLQSTERGWLYRDWVARALNADLPYDEFVRRQLAADHLPDLAPDEIAALGFLGLSPTYWKELKLDPGMIETIVHSEFEERIDCVSRTFLGLTMACARCHDHKYDPIGTEDYYALAGVLASTRLVDRPIIPQPLATAAQQARDEVARLQQEIDELAKKAKEGAPLPLDMEQHLEALRSKVAALQATPHYNTPLAHAVDDAALFVLPDGPHRTKLEYKPNEARDMRVAIRGNPSNPGAVVPRRFLKVLAGDAPPPFQKGSGRLELADALLNEGRPLLARVIVNRVWGWHFGVGLVDTPSNFGAQGGRPTHPDLLDDLAARFIEHGWSLKWLHRELVLSAVYQQASSLPRSQAPLPPEGDPRAIDPDNHLLWRMNRRRLEVEAWRDTMLAAAGNLDPRMGGPGADLADLGNCRRTLYGLVNRRELNDMLRLFDFPDPNAHGESRVPTTTPLQQLFVLNSPFVRQQALALAGRVQSERPGDVAGQIQRVYQLLFGRDPTPGQLALGLEFLTPRGTRSPDANLWPQYAHALLASSELAFAE